MGCWEWLTECGKTECMRITIYRKDDAQEEPKRKVKRIGKNETKLIDVDARMR